MFEARVPGAIAFALTCLVAAVAAPAAQPTTDREAVGPARCVRCHTREATWWSTEDGPPPRGHVNALLQLESADGLRYAERLGIKDVTDVNEGCVACHATVFRGEAREGVSCESCHGPASTYLDAHAKPGAYRLGVAAGMADLVGNLNVWARRCLSCHLIVDPRLINAGHSSGKTFELGDKFQVVERHWKRTYPATAVSAAGHDVAASLMGPHGR